MPAAEIITIGTEILLGEIVDTNTRHIAHVLRNLGIDLYRTTTIGDNAGRIADVIRASMMHAEIIITTGGLGPTVDDPTRKAVAEAFGVEVEFRDELWQQILEIVSRYGRKHSENQKRQAYVPKGAIAVHNPVGTAPAFIVENKRVSVISLPGVPKEMEYILHESVIPYLQKRYNLNHLIKVRILHTAGSPEADIDEKIGDLEILDNPTVGLAAHTGVVDIRITAKAKTEDEANGMIAKIETQLRDRLGSIVFGADEDTLENAALRAASDQNWNLIVVESGLDSVLTRRLAKVQSENLLGSESAQLREGELTYCLKEAKKKHHAQAALGVASFPEFQKVELMLITPQTTKERVLTFGGHPGLLTRWSINLALNWLRRTAERSGQSR